MFCFAILFILIRSTNFSSLCVYILKILENRMATLMDDLDVCKELGLLGGGGGGGYDDEHVPYLFGYKTKSFYFKITQNM